MIILLNIKIPLQRDMLIHSQEILFMYTVLCNGEVKQVVHKRVLWSCWSKGKFSFASRRYNWWPRNSCILAHWGAGWAKNRKSEIQDVQGNVPIAVTPKQLLKSNQHSGYITHVVTLYHQDAVNCVYQPWSHFQNRIDHHGCCRAEQFAYGKTAGCLQRPGYNVHQWPSARQRWTTEWARSVAVPLAR